MSGKKNNNSEGENKVGKDGRFSLYEFTTKKKKKKKKKKK